MSVLNSLIDTVDRFTAATSFEDRWDVAKQTVAEFGARDLNVGEIDPRQGEIKWIASSMPDNWMTHYVENKYYEVDRLVRHGLISFDPMALEFKSAIGPKDAPLLGQDMYSDLADLGYTAVIGQAFLYGPSQNLLGTSFIADTALMSLGGPEQHKHMERTAALISAFLGPPPSHISQDVHFFARPPLPPRQREVLTYLAAGFQYCAIAGKLGISEHTVRAHSKAACATLGAETREQAVAIAVRDQLISV